MPNDFATAAAARTQHIQMTGPTRATPRLRHPLVHQPQMPEGHTFDQVLEWMVPPFRECADYGCERGVIIGLEHHNDFLKTADESEGR